MDYYELVQKRKQFSFEDLPVVKNEGKDIRLINPQNICNGDFDKEEELNAWSKWQGDLKADILVIGQDWGGEQCYIKQNGKDSDKDDTNRNLIKLFESIGIKVRKPSEQYLNKENQNLFFTNCIMGIKEGKKKCSIDKWIKRNAEEFIEPLLFYVLNPKVIMTSGLPAFKSINYVSRN